MSRKTAFNVILIYALVSLVLIVCIPYVGFFSGLIPEVSGWYFSDVVKAVLNSPDTVFDSVFIASYVFAFLSSSFIAVFASARVKSMTVISSLAGLSASLWTLFTIINEYGESSVFDFDYCCTSISFWLCLAAYIVSFFSAAFVPRE